MLIGLKNYIDLSSNKLVVPTHAIDLENNSLKPYRWNDVGNTLSYK